MLPPMEVRKAVLMAAGRGTRLGALTANTPKPMLQVGGQPLISHIVQGLVNAGLRHFIIVCGHLGDQVERWCDGFAAENPGVAVQAVRQRELNGTAGALLAARDLLRADHRFIFGWGDVLMDSANYVRFLADAQTIECDLLLAVNAVDDPWRGAAVYVDSAMRVVRLVEKPPRGASTTRWNNAGLFAASRVIFDYLDRLEPSVRGERELPQAIAAMIADGRSVRAFEVRGFWSDVGTPEDLAAARSHFAAR